MRVRLVVLCVALVLATASCDFDWPMFRFGPARTGSSPDTSISKEAVSSSVALSWTATTGGAVLSSPAVAAGKVYVGSQDDFFRAYDARGEANCSGSPKTCSALWTAGFGGAVRSSPAVANGVVYVGTMNFGDPGVAVANFYAFDAAGVLNCSGTPRICSPLWYGITGPVVQSSPVVANGVVYVSSAGATGSGDNKLYAFDAAGNTNCSGSPKKCDPLWTAATGGAIASSPAVADGVVYVGADDGTLYAFDAAGSTNCAGTPKTCGPLWTASLQGANPSESPAVAGGKVYVAIADVTSTGEEFSGLLAFDAAGNTNCSGTPMTCTPLWDQSLAANSVVSSPAVAGGAVFVNDGDGKLHVFDAANGTNLWTAATGSGGSSSPAVANGVVYVGSRDDKLYAFDAAGTTNCAGSPKTCTSLWNVSTGGSVDSSPAVSHGAVYVGSNDHKLYAFGLEKVPPTTSILVPSNGATLSGTATLDASASDNVRVSGVEFRLTGGSYNNALVGTATLTIYGWIAQWDTTSVPNGTYTLNSVAADPAGNQGRSPDTSITVQN